MRLRNLVALDASNNKLEYIHENASLMVNRLNYLPFQICLLRNLQFLKLQQNELKNLPYSLLYGRRYRELNLTENPHLFAEPTEEQNETGESKKEVPDLKHIALARAFNCRFVRVLNLFKNVV
jgi:Leucine-rich repeat (LRR) protein